MNGVINKEKETYSAFSTSCEWVNSGSCYKMVAVLHIGSTASDNCKRELLSVKFE